MGKAGQRKRENRKTGKEAIRERGNQKQKRGKGEQEYIERGKQENGKMGKE